MITLLAGDCRDVLATLPAQSVQTIVTSPPYYGLRKYTDDPKEIGQEPTPAAYVAALLAVFADCWRVLRDDGTLWLNLGDSYVGSEYGRVDNGRTNDPSCGKNEKWTHQIPRAERRRKVDHGIPPKNLLGMPWRVAFALQDAGWILRSDIVWSKPNPMPESVRDRPTRSHEYLFLFAKRQRYYYDATAIREENTPDMQRRAAAGHTRGANGKLDMSRQDSATLRGDHAKALDANGRNRRSVWTIATQPYIGAHFATMPEALIAPCILAGSAAQACETCGAAWTRVTEKGEPVQQHWAPSTQKKIDIAQGKHGATSVMNTGYTRPDITIGFSAACRCAVNTGAARSIVLDPFGGSGTVARVAERYQRDSMLIDLNPAYIDLQEERTNGVQVEMQLC